MNKLITAIAIALFATSAHAYNIKGLEPGMVIKTRGDLARILGISPLFVNCGPSKAGGTTCYSRETAGVTLAGQKVGGVLITTNDQGVVDSLLFVFSSSDFQYIADGAKEKFGEPESMNEETVQNRMGASFHNVKLCWSSEDQKMCVERYGSKITEGALRVWTPGYISRVEASNEQAKKDM